MAREVVVVGVGHAAVVPARRVMGPGSPRPRRSGRDDDETISDVIPGGRSKTRDPPPSTFGAAGLPFAQPPVAALIRSEDRRVGKGYLSTCRSWWLPFHENKKKRLTH